MSFLEMPDDDAELIQRISEHCTRSADCYREQRDEWQRNIRFVELGEQWDEEVLRTRAKNRRPALTVNLVRKVALNMAGVLQQEKLAIKVKGVDSDTDIPVANVYDAIIESIEKRSGRGAINTAIQHAITGGFGFVRVYPKDENESSFKQEIIIDRVINPLLVYPCPNSTNVNMNDQVACAIVGAYPRYQFEKEFGPYNDNVPVNFPTTTDRRIFFDWHTPETVIIAEFFYKEPRNAEFVLFANGETAELAKAKDEHGNNIQIIVGSGVVVSINGVVTLPQYNIERKKKIKKDVVMWCRVTGDRVLDKPREFPIQNATIPIFLLPGHEIWVGDKRYMRPITYDGHDSQVMYNVSLTTQMEVVQLQPFSPFLGTETQLAKHQKAWEDARDKLALAIPYTPDPDTQPGPPQRQTPPQGSTGIAHLMEIAKVNITDTIGRYASSFGDVGDRTSNKSLVSQQRLSDNTQYAFLDHLNTLVIEMGRCILSMIPRVYTPTQVERILGAARVNELLAQSISIDNILSDLSASRFDMVVTASPSFATRREEALQTLMLIINASPDLAPKILDLLVKTLDFEFQDELMRRLKILNPELFPDDPAAQQVLAQQQAALQQAQQQQMLEWERDKAGLEGKLIANTGREIKVREAMLKQQDNAAAREEVVAGMHILQQ